MRLKTIPIPQKPKEGDHKEERGFAWWPRKVENKLIWLEYYIIESKFTTKERTHVFQGYGFLKVTGGGWDIIQEKLINK